MSKAYSFYQFINAHGVTKWVDDNGNPMELPDLTNKYRAIMNLPTRQSEFLVLPTNSNYVPENPDIGDLDPVEDPTKATLYIYPNGVSFSFLDPSINVTWQGNIAVVKLTIDKSYTLNINAGQNFYVKEPTYAPYRGLAMSETNWNVTQTQTTIKLVSNEDVTLTFERYEAQIPDEDIYYELVINTTTTINILTGYDSYISSHTSGKTVISAKQGESFKFRATASDYDDVIESVVKNINNLEISGVPVVEGFNHQYEYTTRVFGDSEITIPVTQSNIATVTIVADAHSKFYDKYNVLDVVDSTTATISATKSAIYMCVVEVTSLDYVIDDVTVSGDGRIFGTINTNPSRWEFYFEVNGNDVTLTISSKSKSVDVERDVLTIYAPDCSIDYVFSDMEGVILTNFTEPKTISYPKQYGASFSFLATPNDSNKSIVGVPTISPAIAGDITNSVAVDNGIRYYVTLDTSGSMTITTERDYYTVEIVTECEIISASGNYGTISPKSHGKYTITLPKENYSSFWTGTVVVPNGYSVGNISFPNDKILASYYSNVIQFRILNNVTPSTITINIPTVKNQVEEWSNLSITYSPKYTYATGYPATLATKSSEGYIKIPYKDGYDYRFKICPFTPSDNTMVKSNIGTFFANKVYIYPDSSSSTPDATIDKYWTTVNSVEEYDDYGNVWVKISFLQINAANPNKLAYLRIAFDNFIDVDNNPLPNSTGIYYFTVEEAQYNGGFSEDVYIPTGSLGANYWFDGNNIVDFDFTQEVDPTGETIPYSSCRVEIVDDIDEYNPMRRDSRTKEFTRYQEFKIYALAKDPEGNIHETTTDDIPEGNEADNLNWYITQLARVKLDSIEQNNFNAVFNFIGTIEYYDRIYLTDDELMYTNHNGQVKVSEYLKLLFGSDISEETVAEFEEMNEKIIVPFRDETKAEIARIIAQRYGAYIYENSEGKICFRRGLSLLEYGGDPYKITLDNQFANPQFEKIRDYTDSISVKVNNYTTNTTSTSGSKKILFKSVSVYGQRQGVADWEFLGYADYNADAADDNTVIIDSEAVSNDVMATLSYYDSENVKFNGLKIRFDFDKEYIRDSLVLNLGVGSKDYFDDTESRKVSAGNISQLAKRAIRGNDSLERARISESFLEFYVYRGDTVDINTFVPFPSLTWSHIGTSINSSDNNTGMYYLFYMSCWSPLGFFGNLKGSEISNSSTNYVFKNGDISSETIDVDNPLIISLNQAKILERYFKIMYNRDMYEIEGNWVGDGTIDVPTILSVGFPIGRGDEKTYENYYVGEVVKNNISSQGGFTQTSRVALMPEKLFQTEIIANGDYVIEDSAVVNHIYNAIAGEKISLKAGNGVKLQSNNITV